MTSRRRAGGFFRLASLTSGKPRCAWGGAGSNDHIMLRDALRGARNGRRDMIDAGAGGRRGRDVG